MPREDDLRLQDIDIAARHLEQFLEGVTREQFLDDTEKQYAVLHAIEIIGEAAYHVSDQRKAELELIPWEEIRAIRNRLAHEYFAVDLGMIWTAIESDLSVLLDILSDCIDLPDDDDDSAAGAPVPR